MAHLGEYLGRLKSIGLRLSGYRRDRKIEAPAERVDEFTLTPDFLALIYMPRQEGMQVNKLRVTDPWSGS